MKTFLYTLKVWGTMILCVTPVIIYGFYEFSSGFTLSFALFAFLLFLVVKLPFALVSWLAANYLYKKDMAAIKKKRWMMLVNILLQIAGFFATPLFVGSGTTEAVTVLLALMSMAVFTWLFPFPSHRYLRVSDSLKGRHILLRLQENNLLLHGVVLSELNIWPIKVQLDDKTAHPLLELHSMQPNELFTTLGYQTSVQVKAFTAGRQEFLFTATLELDHTLN